jgi:hypothetical protein
MVVEWVLTMDDLMSQMLEKKTASIAREGVRGMASSFEVSVEDLSRRDLIVSGITGDQEAIDALSRGSPLPQQKLIELRFKGMQTVRFEFIVRLMQLKIEIYTLSIYWEDGRNFSQRPTLQNGACKLVYASAVRVSGEFEDISLLRYSHDPGVKAELDAELDRMVAAIGNFLGKPVSSA